MIDLQVQDRIEYTSTSVTHSALQCSKSCIVYAVVLRLVTLQDIPSQLGNLLGNHAALHSQRTFSQVQLTFHPAGLLSVK